MSESATDARWPKVLSLAVHEFRTPMTVIGGYLRMLLQERAGPLSEPQRHMLAEAEKSCGRMSALLAELSDLSGLESGSGRFQRAPIDLRSTLAEAVEGLPALSDWPVAIDLQLEPGVAILEGDPLRLRAAFSAVLHALRRELVSSTTLTIREQVREVDGRPTSWITIAEPDRIAHVAAAPRLDTFDEWRGGSGLSLGVARRVIEAHGGRIWSPGEDAKAGAVIALPHA